MEVAGLILGAAQAVAQLAGVVKRHVVSFSSLKTLAASVEAKAERAWGVAQQLSRFSETPGLSYDLLKHTLDDLSLIQESLSDVVRRIENWKSAGAFLQAPVLEVLLNKIDDKLTQIDYFFRMVGMLETMNAVQRFEANQSRQELRELILEACSVILPASVEGNQARVRLLELQAQPTLGNLPRNPIFTPENNADTMFNLGLADYGLIPGSEKPFGHRAEPHKIRSAARYFHRACVLGKREAFRYLGDIYYEGEGVEVCFRTALSLFQQGAARKDPASTFKLGWCYGFGHGVEVQPSTCVRLLEEAVEGEHGEAMFQLGALKLYGKMVQSNFSEAYRLLKRAEKKDVFQAKEVLAKCYIYGVGVERDPIKAFDFFRASFDGGNYFATVPLAECYDKGIGVEQDLEEASRIYEKCMESGGWYGDFYKSYYGLRMIKGEGVQKNVAYGKALIIESTKSGSALSWQALGECYRRGFGVSQDFNQAKKFYLRAVGLKNGVQGIARSYLALGEMYESGQGVLPDTRRASKYYLSAAERLNQAAQWKVGNAFEAGIGQNKNLHRAVHFFKLCANSGHSLAQRKTVTYYMKGHGLERSRIHVRRILEEEAKKGNREAKRWIRHEKRRSFGALVRYWSI